MINGKELYDDQELTGLSKYQIDSRLYEYWTNTSRNLKVVNRDKTESVKEALSNFFNAQQKMDRHLAYTQNLMPTDTLKYFEVTKGPNIMGFYWVGPEGEVLPVPMGQIDGQYNIVKKKLDVDEGVVHDSPKNKAMRNFYGMVSSKAKKIAAKYPWLNKPLNKLADYAENMEKKLEDPNYMAKRLTEVVGHEYGHHTQNTIKDKNGNTVIDQLGDTKPIEAGNVGFTKESLGLGESYPRETTKMYKVLDNMHSKASDIYRMAKHGLANLVSKKYQLQPA